MSPRTRRRRRLLLYAHVLQRLELDQVDSRYRVFELSEVNAVTRCAHDEPISEDDAKFVGPSGFGEFLMHDAPVDFPGALGAVLVVLFLLHARPAGEPHQTAGAAGV